MRDSVPPHLSNTPTIAFKISHILEYSRLEIGLNFFNEKISMYVCIYIYVSPHATDLTKKSGHHLIEYPHISLFASSVVGVGCGGFVRSSSTCKLEVSSKSYIRF